MDLKNCAELKNSSKIDFFLKSVMMRHLTFNSALPDVD